MAVNPLRQVPSHLILHALSDSDPFEPVLGLWPKDRGWRPLTDPEAIARWDEYMGKENSTRQDGLFILLKLFPTPVVLKESDEQKKKPGDGGGERS